MRLSSAVHTHTKQVDRDLNRANHLPQDQHLGDGVVHRRLRRRAFTQKLKKMEERYFSRTVNKVDRKIGLQPPDLAYCLLFE